MAAGTRTTKEDRGGLSRAAFRAARGSRRRHDDELIASVLGDVAPHFTSNPLDGPDIIGAVPRTPHGPAAGAAGGAQVTSTANDYVEGQADWFKGTGIEGRPASPPKSAAVKKPQAPSLAQAVKEASMGLAAEQLVGSSDGEPPLYLGLPGDDFEKMLDDISRPPNTYM